MKKLATLASALVLSAAAGSASAAVINVSASFTGTMTGAAVGTQTGTGTGTYDDSTGILTLDTAYTINAVAYGVLPVQQNQTALTVANFNTNIATTTIYTCQTLPGYSDLCGNVPLNAPTNSSITSGNYLSFVSSASNSGANVITTWTITPEVSEVPVPAAAWLFGSALLGLTGVSRRRKAA